MVGFIPQCVTKHLPDAGKFVLPVQRQDHSEQPIKLCPLHALPEHKNIFCERLLFLRPGQVHVTSKTTGHATDEFIFTDDCRHVLKHSLALVWIDSKRTDHVEQRVRVDIFLVRMTPQHQF